MTEYLRPPDDIVAVLDAPGPPGAYPSPDCRSILLADRWTYPPVERLARPWLGLAGVRVDPTLGARRRIDAITAMTVVDVEDATTQGVAVPEGSLLSPPQWSPDSTRFAFTREARQGIELWVGDARAATAWPLPDLAVNDTIVAVAAGSLSFAATSRGLRGHAMASGCWGRSGPRTAAKLRLRASANPSGPRVEETAGKHSSAGDVPGSTPRRCRRRSVRLVRSVTAGVDRSGHR